MGSQAWGLISGLWGDAGENFINLAGGADKVFGKKPEIAPFVPVDLSAESGKALAANLENFPEITDWLNKVIPGFSDILAKGTENTLAELSGQLPQDVQDQIQRSSAFQSLMGGYSGTPMARALTARDLGLSSLNLTQMGNNSAQLWSGLAEQAYSPWTVSTSEQAAQTAANNAGQQANLQFKYNVAAAPDPGAAGQFNVDAALGQQMLSIGAGFAGGAMGGGGSSPSAQTNPAGTNWQLYGGTGNQPAYQYNPQTGAFQPVPQAQPAGAWSDRRLKSDIRLAGQSPSGLNIYRFRYRNGPPVEFEGVMADEVETIRPEAVSDVGGYKFVDYDQLDVKFRKVA